MSIHLSSHRTIGTRSGNTDIVAHYTASGIAAVINFPLWKASAIGQSGFQVVGQNGGGLLARYIDAMRPPYKGVFATMAGMCWARATIFWGSEKGKELLFQQYGWSGPYAGVLPALVVSTGVQIVNMPIIRATITLQNPSSPYNTASEALIAIYRKGGIKGLWLGTTAGIAKTVPKYITAVVVKDNMEEFLEPVGPDASRLQIVFRSALKATTAGLAGAVLTNPLDVLRNECFKREKNVSESLRALYKDEGLKFVYRGLGKNVVAVTVPITTTIFLADLIGRARQV